jgi:hypothetical protein
MKQYFIDFENVNSAGIHGAKDLNKDAFIHIFYSQNAKSLSMDAVAELTKGKGTIYYRKLTEAGHNAMDFELISIMSAMIGEKKEGEYFIISNDKGYVSAIKCLLKEYSDKPIKIYQASSIANTLGNRDALITQHFRSVNKEQEFDTKVKNLLSGSAYETHIPFIKNAIHNTHCKQEFCTLLIKTLGNQLGMNVYKFLKGDYFELRDALQF